MHGGFTDWSPWSNCSEECGEGLKTRTRNCTNPLPQFGGEDCEGNGKEEESCKNKECPG